MNSRSHQRAHAIIIATNRGGHWIPMKAFLLRLVKHGISCSIVSCPSRLLELQELQQKGDFGNVDVELIEGLSDTMKRIGSIDVAIEELRDQFYERPQAMQQLVTGISSRSGPNFMVVDMFLYWTKDIAEKLEIPRYIFYTSPCSFALLFLQSLDIIAEGMYPTNPDRSKLDEMVNLPGLELFRVRDLPIQLYDAREFYDLHGKVDGFVVNSFQQYEGVLASTLRTLLPRIVPYAKVPSVFLIGPLAGYPSVGQKQKVESDCLQFLDLQPATSVIYICFGSKYQPASSSLTELARGLELIDTPFLWILPPSPTNAADLDFLPAGFLSRTKGRGLVWSGWAPQTAILDHPAVGGFVSHCGWNSVQEAILGCVPIVTWPLFAEQAMNARFIVRELKVAVPIFENADDKIEGEDIARAIRLIVDSKTREAVKARMQELKTKALAAVAEGGSSRADFEKFVEEVTSQVPSGINDWSSQKHVFLSENVKRDDISKLCTGMQIQTGTTTSERAC